MLWLIEIDPLLRQTVPQKRLLLDNFDLWTNINIDRKGLECWFCPYFNKDLNSYKQIIILFFFAEKEEEFKNVIPTPKREKVQAFVKKIILEKPRPVALKI